jgi:hypothetical protein
MMFLENNIYISEREDDENLNEPKIVDINDYYSFDLDIDEDIDSNDMYETEDEILDRDEREVYFSYMHNLNLSWSDFM